MEPGREPALLGSAGAHPRPGLRPHGSRRPSWRRLITAPAIAGLLAASGAAGYGLVTAAQHDRDGPALSQTGSNGTIERGGLAHRPAASVPPPRITGTFTYQQNEMVYFEISYSDPGHHAVGFGFVGVEGSDWPLQYYPFSDPADGIVEQNSISYPLNQGCGTGFEYTSNVKAWIYDSAGNRSKPVIIHLACTT